jgi:transposase
LSKREQNRLVVLNEVEKGKMRIGQAAEVLGISERQGWRILAAYREEGAAGLAHGNRGRKPVHSLGEEIRKQILELAREKYEGFNHQHLTENLREQEGWEVSRSSVRRILLFERGALGKPPDWEEQLSGQERRTRFGRLLKELGIESIASYSQI